MLLLVETARQVEAGELDPAQPLPRLAEDAVQDSGIWQSWPRTGSASTTWPTSSAS